MVSTPSITDIFRCGAALEHDIGIPRFALRSDGILDRNSLGGGQLAVAQPVLDIIIVEAPFPQISVHVVQPKCIVLLLPDWHCWRPVSAANPPVTRNVRKRIAVVRGIDCISVAKSASCQRPARKFPLGFRGKIELVSSRTRTENAQKLIG